VRIKLAPTSREKPAAIEKNAAEEEMSRMVAGGLRTQYLIGRTCQGITKLARPKEMFAQSPNLVEARILCEANRSITVCLHNLWISSKRKHAVK
jgi:hypothetical protein